jgi:PRC-barrel domain
VGLPGGGWREEPVEDQRGFHMPTFDYDDAPNWRGLTVIDRDGDPVGVITDIYVDDLTGRPEWATVKASLVGGRAIFVPLAQAQLHAQRVQVPYERSHLQAAPDLGSVDHLDTDEEARLYQHYGLDYGAAAAPAGAGGAGSDLAPPATDVLDREAGDARPRERRGRLRRHEIAHAQTEFTGEDPNRTRDL